MLFVVTVWVLCYFPINSFSEGRPAHTLQLGFERDIPFIPFFVVFYVMAYLVVVMPYFVVRDIRDYRRAVAAYLFIILISSAVYILYPVKAARPEISGHGIFLDIIALVYLVAKPYNLFPSLHVSLSAISSMVCLKHNKAIGYSLILLVFLISLSTLFVKQHYLADIISAAVLAFISYYMFLSKKIV
ncbi:phosphatase PAP2 family protein [Candidatus Woesearchaeota archaeon]|nr:phosphatase PAP2 family protein [Candidatus Woesearchaeota archaeon]